MSLLGMFGRGSRPSGLLAGGAVPAVPGAASMSRLNAPQPNWDHHFRNVGDQDGFNGAVKNLLADPKFQAAAGAPSAPSASGNPSAPDPAIAQAIQDRYGAALHQSKFQRIAGAVGEGLAGMAAMTPPPPPPPAMPSLSPYPDLSPARSPQTPALFGGPSPFDAGNDPSGAQESPSLSPYYPSPYMRGGR